MAKIQIKSEKITPFGGIFPIMECFDRLLGQTIDSILGLRSRFVGYQYSEIIRSLMCLYFCGGSCIEDVTKHLLPTLSLHPTLRTCNSDTILRAIEELTEDNITYVSDAGKAYDFNAAEKLIELKETCKDIFIVACIPFIGQESRFSPTDQERYNKVINSVDSKVIIARTFSKQSYLLRNIYMLEHSSIVVAYFDTNIKKGGTFFTYNKAIKMGKEVRNIF